MDIDLKKITLKELHEDYMNSGYNGVVAFGGILDVRPKYQREFVYSEDKRNAVIDTVLKGFPLNVMYWADKGDGTFEVIDGQQRTISICEYMSCNFSVKIGDNFIQYDGLTDDQKAKFDKYTLDVYNCVGDESEKLEWFKTINIAGEKLGDQELRNAVYTGMWLTDAKKFFSRPNQGAHGMANKLISADPKRQEVLEIALKWITDSKKDGITEYMAKHKKDNDATELRNYFSQAITWVNGVFTTYRQAMKSVEWGILYNKHGKQGFSATTLEAKVSGLMKDDEVDSKKGIYSYVLDGNEKHLSLRQFSDSQKTSTYEKQNGICVHCKKHFEINDMEADHITAWSKGGKTNDDNCQMLCVQCNRSKSSK